MKTLKRLGSKSGIAACAAALFIGVVALADGGGSGSGDPCGSGAYSCDCTDDGKQLHTCCSLNHCKVSSWDVTGPYGIAIHHCSVKCTT